MADRSKDWFAQAERDLEQAKSSKREGRHEGACLVARLLRELPLTVPEELVEKGKVLDGFYIATRYANGHPEGAPFEHYGTIQSTDAINYAGEIIKFVRSQMA